MAQRGARAEDADLAGPAAARRLCAAAGLVACGLAWAQAGMQLRSDDIVTGRIARPLACAEQGGQDRSPQFTLSGVPATARYLAIVVDDPDAMRPAGKIWVHWNRVNIDARTARVAGGKPPPGDELVTSFGTRGYGGMCPPDGVHRYRFAVFALKDRIDARGSGAPAELTLEAFEKHFRSSILASAVIEGRF